MIQEGRSDNEILEFMVTRYGDFVLYRPPVKAITLLLWGGPIALLLIAVLSLRSYLKRRSILVAKTDKPLSAEEARRAAFPEEVAALACARLEHELLLLEAERPGTEILHPVAVVIFSGLISSTLLDTFLTPALFWLFGRKDAERLLDDKNAEAF